MPINQHLLKYYDTIIAGYITFPLGDNFLYFPDIYITYVFKYLSTLLAVWLTLDALQNPSVHFKHSWHIFHNVCRLFWCLFSFRLTNNEKESPRVFFR